MADLIRNNLHEHVLFKPPLEAIDIPRPAPPSTADTVVNYIADLDRLPEPYRQQAIEDREKGITSQFRFTDKDGPRPVFPEQQFGDVYPAIQNWLLGEEMPRFVLSKEFFDVHRAKDIFKDKMQKEKIEDIFDYTRLRGESINNIAEEDQKIMSMYSLCGPLTAGKFRYYIAILCNVHYLYYLQRIKRFIRKDGKKLPYPTANFANATIYVSWNPDVQSGKNGSLLFRTKKEEIMYKELIATLDPDQYQRMFSTTIKQGGVAEDDHAWDDDFLLMVGDFPTQKVLEVAFARAEAELQDLSDNINGLTGDGSDDPGETLVTPQKIIGQLSLIPELKNGLIGLKEECLMSVKALRTRENKSSNFSDSEDSDFTDEEMEEV